MKVRLCTIGHNQDCPCLNVPENSDADIECNLEFPIDWGTVAGRENDIIHYSRYCRLDKIIVRGIPLKPIEIDDSELTR